MNLAGRMYHTDDSSARGSLAGVSLLLLPLLLPVVVPPLHARIIHVPEDSSSVQRGINGAVDGDTVMVAPGTYHEYGISFQGKAIRVTGTDPGDSSIVAGTVVAGDLLGPVFVFESGEDRSSVLTGLAIMGGKSPSGGGISCGFSSAPTITKNHIVENTAAYAGGGIACNGCSAWIADNLIRTNSATGIGSMGGGLAVSGGAAVISNNRILGNSAEAGGGASCSGSLPIISGNVVEDNVALEIGGGIYCADFSSPEITDNIISDNRVEGGTGGGGIGCFVGSSPTIARNILTGNEAAMGGGILCMSSSPFISNNNITGNTAQGEGGGVSCFPGITDSDVTGSSVTGFTPVLSNDIITANTAAWGGGLFSHGMSPEVRNCTIVDNRATWRGGAVYCYDTSLTVVNSILWGNAVSEIDAAGQMQEASRIVIGYSDVEGGQTSIKLEGDSRLQWGDGMLDSDPQFRDPGLVDLHLKAIECGSDADSPCVDAGDPSIVDSLLDCSHGLGSARSDVGAYGGAGGGPPVSIVSGDGRGPVLIPRSFVLHQNHPNPFNPSTTIRLDIPQEASPGSRIHLVVYDLRGRRVRVLVDSDLRAGSHDIVWNGRDEQENPVPSGIYLYRLQAGDVRVTRKMTILK